jgi:hydrogenase maturation protease
VDAQARQTGVFAIGRDDAGDDAIGPLVVRTLAGELQAAGVGGGVRCRCLAHPAALLDELASCGRALVVDAALAGEPAGTLRRYDLALGPLPVATAAATGRSTHGFGLAAVLELARSLGRLPARCEVWTVEAEATALRLGVAPSAACRSAVSRVAAALYAELVPGLAGDGARPGVPRPALHRASP